MTLSILNPLWAILGIGLIAALATVLARFVPFFKRALNEESVARLTPLDGLRGILCFAVMFHHGAITHFFLRARPPAWEPPPSVFYRLLGESAVAMFFCTTGFLFWSAAIRRKGTIPLRDFARSRVLRIAPMLAFASIVAVLITLGRVQWASKSGLLGLAKLATFGVLTWPTVHGFPLGIVDAFVTWTLQFEWAFYAVLPFLALLVTRRIWPVIFIAIATALLFFASGACVYFCSGILAAHVFSSPKWAMRMQTPIAAALAAGAICVLPFVASGGYDKIAILLTTIAFVPIACGNGIWGLLNFSGLRLMGIVSYSVYLLHGTVLFLAQPLLSRAVGPSPRSIARYWCCIIALGMFTCVLSMCTYRWIEFPFMALEKRLRRTPTTDATIKQLSGEASAINIGTSAAAATLPD